jgi:hypothetical protein
MTQPSADDRSRYSDLDIHELVVHRIYHEDFLFAQRSYTLLTVHAFLATAFSVLLVSDSEKKSWLVAACLVSGLGAVLGILQSALGRQTNRAIGFWREYVKLIEAKCEIPFDTLQYDFYEKAVAFTPFGTINKRSEGEKALYPSRPRAFTSHTILIGFVLPLLLTLLWTTGMVLMLWFHNHKCVAIASIGALVTLLGLTNPIRLARAKGTPMSDKAKSPEVTTE